MNRVCEISGAKLKTNYSRMNIRIHKIKQISKNQNIGYLIKKPKELSDIGLDKKESDYISKRFPKDNSKLFTFNRYDYWILVCVVPEKTKKEEYYKKEILRKLGIETFEFLKKENISSLIIKADNIDKHHLLALAEGIILSSYSFNKYKQKEKPHKLSQLHLYNNSLSQKDISELSYLTDSVFICRDLVNEPGSTLTASKFSEFVKEECTKTGIKVEILGKSRMRSLKMAGLLAVNQGSTNEPTFTVLEWKPKNAINKKPYVLVGKGVMFDSGGLSLKPPSAMEAMKSDMAGAASVFSVIRTIALNKLNIHVVGLLPATDNIPGQNALAPGDVIKMSNGKTIEVLNTDAEGRLILADALCYAEKYNPELVIDVATLTGSASVAIGKHGIVGLQHNSKKQMGLLMKSGFNVYERIVEFPLWEEYDKEIESDIADIKNIGSGKSAGMITAACFLKNFISYPWIHLDIAGMGYMESKEGYLGKGGTAIGVRLLYDFFKHKISIKE